MGASNQYLIAPRPWCAACLDLTGAPVMATVPQGVSALWSLAGLSAEGDTILNRFYHLDRVPMID